MVTALGASACSVPVFRYALDRWPADALVVEVFHRGKFDADTKAFCDTVRQAGNAPTNAANVYLQIRDLDSPAPSDMQEIFDVDGPQPAHIQEEKEKLSAAKLSLARCYYTEGERVFWAGKPDGARARALVGSPVRRAVARGLLSGSTAVWVMVDSGDAKKDKAFFALLSKTLDVLKKDLVLPALTEEDKAQYMSPGGKTLGIDFPIIRIGRDAHEESMFVAMLQGMEDGVPKDEPIAVPIFGRGRGLGVLRSGSEMADMIAGMSMFLVGSCSCQVKMLNPGVDLLLPVSWDLVLYDGVALDKVLPPAPGRKK